MPGILVASQQQTCAYGGDAIRGFRNAVSRVRTATRRSSRRSAEFEKGMPSPSALTSL